MKAKLIAELSSNHLRPDTLAEFATEANGLVRKYPIAFFALEVGVLINIDDAENLIADDPDVPEELKALIHELWGEVSWALVGPEFDESPELPVFDN